MPSKLYSLFSWGVPFTERWYYFPWNITGSELVLPRLEEFWDWMRIPILILLYFTFLNSKDGFTKLIILGGRKPLSSLFITEKQWVQFQCPAGREWIRVIHLEKCSQYVPWETKLSGSRQVIPKTEGDQRKSQFTVGSPFCLEKLIYRLSKGWSRTMLCSPPPTTTSKLLLTYRTAVIGKPLKPSWAAS